MQWILMVSVISVAFIQPGHQLVSVGTQNWDFPCCIAVKAIAQCMILFVQFSCIVQISTFYLLVVTATEESDCISASFRTKKVQQI